MTWLRFSFAAILVLTVAACAREASAGHDSTNVDPQTRFCAWVLVVLCASEEAAPTRAEPVNNDRNLLDPADPVGCYDLQIGEWTPDPDLRSLIIAIGSGGIADVPLVVFNHNLRRISFGRLGREEVTTPGDLPYRVQLDSVAEQGRFGKQLRPAMRKVPGTLGTRWPAGSWLVERKELLLRWHGYHGGPAARLQWKRADRLEGKVKYRAYPSGRPVVAPVTATHVLCDAPIPADQVGEYRYPRGIELANGDSIRLDERLPDSVDHDPSERRGMFIGLRTQAAERPERGLFEGAYDIRVRFAPDGRVTEIRFSLPVASTLMVELERLEGLIGPATEVGPSTWTWEQHRMAVLRAGLVPVAPPVEAVDTNVIDVAAVAGCWHPRGIALPDGDSIRLDERLPARRQGSPASLRAYGSGMLLLSIVGAKSGVFADAHDIRVRSRSGDRVAELRFALPLEEPPRLALERLKTMFGPPTVAGTSWRSGTTAGSSWVEWKQDGVMELFVGFTQDTSRPHLEFRMKLANGW